MEYLPLLGIAIIVIGFVMKIDTIAVVVIAGLVTGLISGMSFIEILAVLGEGFVGNRLVTLFVLTLTMIGLSERYGLKNQAVHLINNVHDLTTGRFLSLYLFIREVSGAVSLRLGGHPQFIRPLIEPMALASAVSNYGELEEETKEEIKAQAAAMENFGNFYAQNTFVGAAGTLLISGTLSSLGYDAPASSLAVTSFAIAIIALIMGIIYNYLFDKKLERQYGRAGEKK